MYFFYMFPIRKSGWVDALQQVSDFQCLKIFHKEAPLPIRTLLRRYKSCHCSGFFQEVG